ncbi:MAG: LacI family DNA-binding transcriptional regulator [Ardenticatenaceae bacterium]|nr:LacI family DNA-binding transcriptional regulator [Ardenticatenaceae bacterium]
MIKEILDTHFPMAVTIKDIASKAGVSHTTVSRALRNHPSISQHTVERIQELAAEMGYVPNTVARNLKNSRSSVMGVVVRRFVDPFLSEVLDGIESVLTAHGYSIFLTQSKRDPQKIDSIIRNLSEQRVAGAILCSTEIGAEERQRLLRFGVPSVLVNSQLIPDMDFAIYNDDIFGIKQIVTHLANLGHRRIAYIGHQYAGRETVKRRQGFEEGMAESGLKILPGFIVNGSNGRPSGGAEGATQLLKRPNLPTAIVCFNDMMAVGAIHHLEQTGVKIPAEVSVTGFDNIEISKFVSPLLTTFNQPKFELGQKASLMILERINHGKMTANHPQRVSAPDDQKSVMLRGELIVRASTAKPPTAEI